MTDYYVAAPGRMARRRSHQAQPHAAPVCNDAADLLRRRVRDQPLDGRQRRPSMSASRTRSGSACARPTSVGPQRGSVEPVPGLPDMVYAANGGFIADDIAIVARFRFAERAGESRAYAEWMSSRGYRPVTTRHVNEGQGDLLMVGQMVLAGYGFRTDRRAHTEISAALGMPVVSLELVDPRFYHLDTALAVLDDHTIAFYPPAFSAAAQRQLHALFPDAIVVGSADAYRARAERRLRRPARCAAFCRNGFRHTTG